MRAMTCIHAHSDGFGLQRLDLVRCLGSNPWILRTPEEEERHLERGKQVVDVDGGAVSVPLDDAVEYLGHVGIS